MMLLLAEAQRSRFDARHIEQIDEEPIHTCGGERNAFGGLASEFVVLRAVNSLRVHRDDTQRAAQVVRHHGQHFVPTLLLRLRPGKSAPGLTKRARCSVRAVPLG
jgi:hypothetical protein